MHRSIRARTSGIVGALGLCAAVLSLIPGASAAHYCGSSDLYSPLFNLGGDGTELVVYAGLNSQCMGVVYCHGSDLNLHCAGV